MEKQFVTYEIALKLKELRFDKPCLGWFEKGQLCVVGQRFDKVIEDTTSFELEKEVLAPLWQQVIDWIREDNNIDIIIKSWTGNTPNTKTYAAEVYIFGTSIYNKLQRELSYQESRKGAILKAIELIKNNKT